MGSTSPLATSWLKTCGRREQRAIRADHVVNETPSVGVVGGHGLELVDVIGELETLPRRSQQCD